MKTKISIILFTLTLLLVSCEKDTEGVSRITYFPIFTVTGSDEIFLKVGDTYTEPGVTATEAGKQLDVKVDVAGEFFGYTGSTVKTSAADIYRLSYSAVNKDGFSGSASRSVVVATNGDLVSSIEGLYASTVKRNNATGAQYTNMKYVMISKIAPNKYVLSDGIGGYYEFGRSYGSGYRASGIEITATDIVNNVFSFSGAVGVGAFGGSCLVSSLEVKPSSKQIVCKSSWDSGSTVYAFDITLTQVEL